MDRTNGRLDLAVVAYRENPSQETLRELLALQSEHAAHFMREQTGEYISRTK